MKHRVYDKIRLIHYIVREFICYWAMQYLYHAEFTSGSSARPLAYTLITKDIIVCIQKWQYLVKYVTF